MHGIIERLTRLAIIQWHTVYELLAGFIRQTACFEDPWNWPIYVCVYVYWKLLIDCFISINIILSSLKLARNFFWTPSFPLKIVNPWLLFTVSSKCHVKNEEAFIWSLFRKSSNCFHVYLLFLLPSSSSLLVVIIV